MSNLRLLAPRMLKVPILIGKLLSAVDGGEDTIAATSIVSIEFQVDGIRLGFLRSAKIRWNQVLLLETLARLSEPLVLN